MAFYKISGVRKADGVISHYAFHETTGNVTYKGVKTSKADAIRLLSNGNNTAITRTWNYQKAFWEDEEHVEVVSGIYLRSNPDSRLTDNLAHLINYDSLQ